MVAKTGRTKEGDVMPNLIHPSAIIEAGANLGADVSIGAFSFIGKDVVLGDGVIVKNNATIMGRTKIGANAQIWPGATLGGPPQSIGFKDDGTSALQVGERTILRENVTLHCGIPAYGGVTRIGDDCFMMANTHCGHDVQLGNGNVIANGTQIGGHVETGANVWMGGLVAVHQFTQIGEQAFVGGGAILVGDVIPFGSVVGNHARLTGLNTRGLMRRGYTKSQLQTLRAAYKLLFEADGIFQDRLKQAEATFAGNAEVETILNFIRRKRKRALCQAE